MHDVISSFALILENAIKRNADRFVPIAKQVFNNLRNMDEADALVAWWLRTHIFAYGLFGNKQQDQRSTFLDKDQTEAASRHMAIALRPAHLMGRLIPCRWELTPVYIMIEIGIWDDICRNKLDEALLDDRAVDGFTLMLYGEGFGTGRAMVGAMCTLERYLDRVNQRLKVRGPGQPHRTVRLALEKALQSPY